MNDTKQDRLDEKLEKRMEKEERQGQRMNLVFRQILHWLERVIALITLLALVGNLIMQCWGVIVNPMELQDISHILHGLLGIVVGLEFGLSERHARAVLRLPEARRTEALRQMGRQQMTARQADTYVQKLLEPPPRRPVPMVQDVRIFVNTINRAVRLMVEAGVPASAKRREGEGFIEYTVHIPTGNAKKDP